ncbi:MAG: CHAT domain-containing protein [Cytophagales bacterium]|nr:CHAT domain-containing protein [Cytophagales bacterium]
MRYFVFILLCINISVVLRSQAQVQEAKFNFVKQLIELGDYEEALLYGAKSYKKYKKTDTAMFVIAASYMSKAGYLWYQFKTSEKYFNTGLEYWDKIPAQSENKLIAGLYLAECALIRHDYILCNKILKQITPTSSIIHIEHQAKYLWLESECNQAFGNYTEAMGYLKDGHALFFAFDSTKELQLRNEWEFKFETSHADIMLSYGNYAEVDSAIRMLEKVNIDWKLNTVEHKYTIASLKANLYYAKRWYNKAYKEYLGAYNLLLEYNVNEHRRYESLKMAAISSIKAGAVADYHKLFRRSDMLAFMKPLKAQIFRPGVYQLRINELIETGRYAEAYSRCVDVQNIYKFLPRSNPYYYEFLGLKATAAEYDGRLKEYKNILDTLEIMTDAQFQKKSVKYAQIKLKIAEYMYKYTGELTKSLDIYKKWYVALYKTKMYQYSPHCIPHVQGMSKVYDMIGLNDSSYKTILPGKKMALVYGKNAPELSYFLSQEGFYAFETALYDTSIARLNQAFALKMSTKDEENIYYINALATQATLFRWLGEFAKTKERASSAYKISLRKEEQRFYDQCNMLESLAASLLINGNFIRADRNINTSEKIKNEKAGKDNFLLISTHLQKADIKILKGEVKEADIILEKLKTQLPKYYEEGSKPQAQMLYLLSRYYFAISDFKNAKESLLQSIYITSNIYGPNHVRLAPMYADYSKYIFTENINKYKEADHNYELAKTIVEKSLGTNTPAFADLLTKQADMFVQVGLYTNAGYNLSVAEKFWTAKLGKDNVNNAEIYFIKGIMYYNQKMYNPADDAYKTSANMYGAIFNKNYPMCLSANVGIAKIAYQKKNYNEASDIMEPVLAARLKFIDNNFSIMSFGQKVGFWAKSREEFEFYNSIAYKLTVEKKAEGKTAQMYNFALRTKGLLLNSDAKIRRQVYQSGDSSLIAAFQDWLFQKEYFALVSNMSSGELADEKIDINKLQKSIEDLEKKINAKTAIDLSGADKAITWNDVKKAVGYKSMAVEMLRFRYFNHQMTDTVVYMALLANAKSKDAPDYVIFDETKKMEKQYLNFYRNSTISHEQDVYSYHAYFKPLKEKIPHNYTIYFSGDGVYSQLNLEMFYNTETQKYALEDNTFVYVTNTKDLIANENIKKPTNETQQSQQSGYYLFGNPKFYHTELKKQTIPQLQGAELEVKQINNILFRNSKPAVSMIGDVVTEDTLKSLVSPMVLHISTHGFFMESSKKSGGNALTHDPMLNSGLLLYGSGNILDNHEMTFINQTPGVLTASEVMDLNFTNTNLVVLSACETGRGQVEAGEGVFGLQRAFLVAGAKSIVLSLFKVDDEATQLLMVKFYEKFLKNNGDYRTAFREAKNEIRLIEKFKDPVYWGAFIMIEGQQTKSKDGKGI